MIKLKVLCARAVVAWAVALAGAPVAQADPPAPDPCQAAACQQPPRVAPPPPIRGVLGCVRGVCIPKPNPPHYQR
ncbi:hypothetical protein [Mycobacterium kubicae]|uniref:hypothetical protein n=1 Tax=Mycobacterium kubicae TaxID=120959 RepID=UPI000A9C585A|nr:hypothetical protein [Mycobacterium kubicae]